MRNSKKKTIATTATIGTGAAAAIVAATLIAHGRSKRNSSRSKRNSSRSKRNNSRSKRNNSRSKRNNTDLLTHDVHSTVNKKYTYTVANLGGEQTIIQADTALSEQELKDMYQSKTGTVVADLINSTTGEKGQLVDGSYTTIVRDISTLTENLNNAMKEMREYINNHKQEKEKLNDDLYKYDKNKTLQQYDNLNQRIEDLTEQHNVFVTIYKEYADLFDNLRDFRIRLPDIEYTAQNQTSTANGTFRKMYMGHAFLFRFPPVSPSLSGSRSSS